MHDFEPQLFDALANALEAQVPGVTVVSEDLPSTEPRFPVVQFRLLDATPDARSAESGDMEPRTVVVWEAQVYSNRSRREAKNVAMACDALLASWGWRRTSFSQVDGQDRTIRRFAVRWRGSVGADGQVAR